MTSVPGLTADKPHFIELAARSSRLITFEYRGKRVNGRAIELSLHQALKLGFQTKYFRGNPTLVVVDKIAYEQLFGVGVLGRFNCGRDFFGSSKIILPEGFSESELVHEILHYIFFKILTSPERRQLIFKVLDLYYASCDEKSPEHHKNRGFYDVIAILTLGNTEISNYDPRRHPEKGVESNELTNFVSECLSYGGQYIHTPSEQARDWRSPVFIPTELRDLLLDLGVFVRQMPLPVCVVGGREVGPIMSPS